MPKKANHQGIFLLSSNALLHQHCYVANRTWETAKSGCEIGLFTTTDSKYTHLCAVCLTLHIAPNLAAHLAVFESSRLVMIICLYEYFKLLILFSEL